jgi:hypothetical protein
MASTQLSELVALISNATKVVEAEFAKSENPKIPSLDDTTTHPFDDRSSMEMKEAVRIIEGACAQLCATVARPSHTILNVGAICDIFYHQIIYLLSENFRCMLPCLVPFNANKPLS